MSAAPLKFLLSFVLLATLCCAICLTTDEGWLTAWFLLATFVALPIFILSWVELGSALRNHPSSSRILFTVGFLFGLPQAFFGLFSLVSGVAIIVWVLYNSFIARVPQYSGGFLTFGIGPVLVLFGTHWLRQAFTRQPPPPG